MTSERRRILVSKDNIQSWIESGLRQFREIQTDEDLVSLFVSPQDKDLVVINYTVKFIEPIKEVYIFK